MKSSKCGMKLTRSKQQQQQQQNPTKTKLKKHLALLKNIPQYAKIWF